MSFCTVSVQVRILSSLDHPSVIRYYGTATENAVATLHCHRFVKHQAVLECHRQRQPKSWILSIAGGGGGGGGGVTVDISDYTLAS